jgi:hypothetical protein
MGSWLEIVKGGDREVKLAPKLQQENGNQMKTRTFRIDWLIPVLGIALVGGAYFPIKSYLGLQEEVRSNEQLTVTLDCLREACGLSQVLTEAQAGGCVVAASGLDELLVANLATDGVRIASADPETRGLLEAFTRFIDRRRSESASMAADGLVGRSDRKVAGQRNVTQTLVSASLAE